MSGKYILVDGEPVAEPDLLKWGRWFEQADNERRVAETFVGDVRISTVFLGLDHGWGKERLLFETMVFGGAHDQYQDRYPSRDEAVAGHQQVVEMVEDASSAEPGADTGGE